MNTSISVITASLNAREHIPALLESLRNQTDRNFQFLLMDGGSTDGTVEYARAAVGIDCRIVSEPDCGIYDALNRAIRRIETEYYLVAGADDRLSPQAIAQYRRVALQTGADVIVAAVRVGGRLKRGFHPQRGWLGHAAMVTSHSVGMMFRRSLHAVFGEYLLRYPTQADGHFIKQVCESPLVRVVGADFVAGEFGITGASRRDVARALCEAWQIQRDTGERPLLQYILFQLRLLKYLPRIVRAS